MKLTTQPTDNVTVGLSGIDSTESSFSASSLVFSPTSWSTAQSVTVTGVDDNFDDGNITYSVTLTSSSTDGSYVGKTNSVSIINVDDDTAGISVTTISGSTSETGSTATFSVSLTSEPTATVTIALTGVATEGTHVPSLTFDNSNWSTSQSVTVTGVDEKIDDGDVTYNLTLQSSSADGGYASKTASVTVVNIDDDVAGISVTAMSGSTSEPSSTASFTVQLTSEPTSPVTISLAGDSSEGTFATPLVFNSGNWSSAATVVVTGVDDNLDDGDITYSVSLTATSSDSKYQGKTSAVSAINIDDDSSAISVSTLSASTSEGGSTATFTVRLTAQPTANVAISIASDDLSEGTISTSTLFFDATNWSTPKSVTVSGVDDSVDDNDVSFNVTLLAISSDANFSGKTGSVSALNVDNDTAGLSVTTLSGNTSEAGSTATFTVKLTSEPTATVTLTLSGDSTEGTLPAALIFSSGNWSTAQTVTVVGKDDFIDDGNVTYGISLAASSGDVTYQGKSSTVSAVNVDNDEVGLSITSISGSTSEAGSTATFSIKLTSEPTADVTIALGGDSSEGSLSASSLTFTSLNWSSVQAVTVTGVDDAIDDNDVTYGVSISVSSSDTGYAGKTSSVTVVNTDNDAVGLSVSTISGTTSEGGSTATFTVKLTSEPGSDVTISLSGDATEGTFAPSLTFTSGNWSSAQTVTVTGVNDAIDDGSVTYGVALAASSLDLGYQGKTGTVSVVNLDDADTAGLSVTTISGATSEGGSTATFSVVLNSEPTSNVLVILGGDSSEGSIVPSITFTPGNWSTAQAVTVAGVNDAIDDGDVTYNINLSLTSIDSLYDGATASVAVVNLDDADTAGISLTSISGSTTEAGSTATFTVKLTSEPTASVTINLTGDTSEGTIPASLTFTSSNWSTAQTVTVAGADDKVDDGDITYSVSLTTTTTDTGYSSLTSSISVVNVDDDTAGLSVTTISGNTTEGGTAATFSVKLTSEPTASVTLALSGDATEGSLSASTVVFSIENWSTAQPVTVTGVNDALDDGDITYSVSLSGSSADAKYSGATAAVTVINVDNDASGLSVSSISGNTTEGGSTATFTVQLTAQPTAVVAISLDSSDLSEGTTTPGLVFNASNWSTAQTVTVTGVNDAVDDNDVTYNISLIALGDATFAGKTASVSAVNVDNDTAGISVSTISGSTSELGSNCIVHSAFDFRTYGFGHVDSGR